MTFVNKDIHFSQCSPVFKLGCHINFYMLLPCFNCGFSLHRFQNASFHMSNKVEGITYAKDVAGTLQPNV